MDFNYIIKCLAVIIEGQIVLTERGDGCKHHLAPKIEAAATKLVAAASVSSIFLSLHPGILLTLSRIVV